MTHWRDVGAITGEEVSALEKLLEFVVAITSDVSASPEVRASIPPEMLEGLQSYSTEVRQVLGPVVERWARRQAADEHDRIASHDDDPHASLVDRLLLALGMWPFYVDDLGPDALVKAAAKIRSDAHRFPMAAEDYGTKDDELEEVRDALRMAIVNDTPITVAEAQRLLGLDEEDHG